MPDLPLIDTIFFFLLSRRGANSPFLLGMARFFFLNFFQNVWARIGAAIPVSEIPVFGQKFDTGILKLIPILSFFL